MFIGANSSNIIKIKYGNNYHKAKIAIKEKFLRKYVYKVAILI